MTHEEIKGWSVCPICGIDTPHEHTGLEVHEYRTAEVAYNEREMIEAANRTAQQAENRAKMRAWTESNYQTELNQVHSRYNRMLKDCCDFCRGLPRGAQTLKYSSAESYGLVVDYGKDTATCPSCARVLAHWE